MGRPKALLTVGGVPMIARVAARLGSVCDELIVVTGEPDVAAGLPARIVEDAVPGEGPLRGMEAGLEAAVHEVCIVAGCDMPFVDPNLLRHLLARAGGADAVVPRGAGGRAQPLHAVYRRSCLPAIRDALKRGERKATSFLRAVRVVWIREEEWGRLDPRGRSWWNVNTPADLEEADAPAD